MKKAKANKATPRKTTHKNSDGLEYVIATLPNGARLNLYGDAVIEAKKKRPKSHNKRKPLTLEQAERLADAILWDDAGDNESATNPLLLLMDDLARHGRDDSHIESIANTVMRRCYATTMDADTQEAVYIERVRKQWAKVLG